MISVIVIWRRSRNDSNCDEGGKDASSDKTGSNTTLMISLQLFCAK